MMVARYFKPTWTGAQCCSKDIWFVIHRLMMVLTWFLTLAGFFLIFFELSIPILQIRKKSGKILTKSTTKSKPSSSNESQTNVFAATLSSVSGLLKISSKKVNIADMSQRLFLVHYV